MTAAGGPEVLATADIPVPAPGDARKRNLRIGFELMLTPMLEDLPEARAHQGDILDHCGQLGTDPN